MNILLTGATKFLGEHVCKELLSRGLTFDCLVRPSSDTKTLRGLGASLVQGDLSKPETLKPTLQNYDTVLNIPNLAQLPAAALVGAYEEAGVKRAVFVSSTGIFTQLDARTKPLRLAAEKSIKGSRLTYTILRPTMIYGTPEDENIIKLLRLCQRLPVVPVVGSGRALQQPVHVEDVAWAVAEVLFQPKTHNQSYNIGGGQTLSYNELVKRARQALGKPQRLVHIPSRPAALVAKVAKRTGLPSPVSEEQILRLAEDKAYSLQDAQTDFGYKPRPFDKGVEREVALMKGQD